MENCEFKVYGCKYKAVLLNKTKKSGEALSGCGRIMKVKYSRLSQNHEVVYWSYIATGYYVALSFCP